MSLLVRTKNLNKWPLLQEIDDGIRTRIRKFTCSKCTLYGITNDNQLIAYGDRLLDVQYENVERKLVVIKQLKGKAIADIVGSWNHRMVRTYDGQLWGWGNNVQGKVSSTNAKPHINTPQKIFEKGIISVKVGLEHTIALDQNGKVYAWGSNKYNQLGHFKDNQSTFHAVPLGINVVTQIGCTDFGSSVLTNKGEAFLWGRVTQEKSLCCPTRVMISKPIRSIVCVSCSIVFLTIDGDIYLFSCIHDSLVLVSTKVSYEKIYPFNRHGFIACTKSGQMFSLDEFQLKDSLKLAKQQSNTKRFANSSLIDMKLVSVGFSLSNILEKDIFLLNFPSMLQWRHIDSESFNLSSNLDLTFTFSTGDTIRTHRSLLRAVSEYMKTRLSKNWAPSANVSISDFPHKVFHQYLDYLYTGIIGSNNFDEIYDLCSLAHYYCEFELLDACIDLIMTRYLHAETCVDHLNRLYYLAAIYNLEEFRNKVSLFMIELV